MAIPTDIAGLEAWYKADAITGKVDNDTIAQWDDSSGNARHLTAGGTPSYQTSELNGWPVVRCNGATDSVSHAAGAGFVTGTTCTLLMVYIRPLAGGANARSMALVDLGSGVDYNNQGSFIVFQGGGSDREAVMRETIAVTNQNPHPGVVPMLMTFWFDGTNCNQQYNGVAATVSSGGSTGTFNIGRIVVGAGYDGGAISAFSQHDFAEICLFDNDIGAPARLALHVYLSNKYDLGLTPPTLRVLQPTTR